MVVQIVRLNRVPFLAESLPRQRLFQVRFERVNLYFLQGDEAAQ